MKHEIVPMGDYFYEINLQDVKFINLLAEQKMMMNLLMMTYKFCIMSN